MELPADNEPATPTVVPDEPPPHPAGVANQPAKHADDQAEKTQVDTDPGPETHRDQEPTNVTEIVPPSYSADRLVDEDRTVIPVSSLATYQKALTSQRTTNGLVGPRRVGGGKRGLLSSTSSRPSGNVPSLTPSQAEIGRIPSASRDRRDVQTPKLSRENTRIRNVPNVVKMATVTASPREPTEDLLDFYQPSHYVDGVRRFQKVIGWDVANNSRPPLRIDMEGPTPCSYSPLNKPLNETNAPIWSFGRRSFVEKKGGSRRSWEKAWFHTDDAWRMKTDFVDEIVWPTPMHYYQRPTIGPRQTTKLTYPSFSCGIRRTVDTKKKGTVNQPGPNVYDRDRADRLVYKRAPCYSHSFRLTGTTLWTSGKDSSPGPGSYQPEVSRVMKHKPAFTIVGVRRSKEHELGPFATF